MIIIIHTPCQPTHARGNVKCSFGADSSPFSLCGHPTQNPVFQFSKSIREMKYICMNAHNCTLQPHKQTECMWCVATEFVWIVNFWDWLRNRFSLMMTRSIQFCKKCFRLPFGEMKERERGREREGQENRFKIVSWYLLFILTYLVPTIGIHFKNDKANQMNGRISGYFAPPQRMFSLDFVLNWPFR